MGNAEVNFYSILNYFVVFSIAGWVCEVAYAAIVLGKFVNRGFLAGPWCPIYGFGTVFVVVTLHPLLSGDIFLLFFGSMALTSALEYITGFLLEKVLHQRWWDYTDEPFNIGGYICLRYSMLWGGACVLMLKVLMPLIDMFIDFMPHWICYLNCSVIVCAMLVDFGITAVSAVHLNERLKALDSVSASLRRTSDQIGGAVSKETLDLKNRYEELTTKLGGGEKRLLISFPDASSLSYRESLDKIKANITELTRRGKDGITTLTEKGRSGITTLTEKSRSGINIITEKGRAITAKGKTALLNTYAEVDGSDITIPAGERPFAYGFCYTKLFWVFLTVSFVGSLAETVYSSAMAGAFVPRVGVVFGPFLPAWGIAAFAMTVLMYPLRKKRDLWSVLLGAAIGGTVQYITSLFDETLFHVVMWNFTSSDLNICGRTSGFYMFVWGVAGTVWVKDVYPLFSKFLNKWNKKAGMAVTVILSVLMIADLTLTGAALARYSQRRNGAAANSAFLSFIDRSFDDKYMAEIFPTLTFAGK